MVNWKGRESQGFLLFFSLTIREASLLLNPKEPCKESYPENTNALNNLPRSSKFLN